MSYLDLTGSDQIVDVIESFLHCFTYRHQAMVPQDQHLGRRTNKNLAKNSQIKKHILISAMYFLSYRIWI